MDQRQGSCPPYEDTRGCQINLADVVCRKTILSISIFAIGSLWAWGGIKGDIDVLLLDLGLPDSQGFATFGAGPCRRALRCRCSSQRPSDEEWHPAVSVGAQDYPGQRQVESDTLVRTVLFAN